MEANGYKFNYKILTWAQSLKDAREGKIDGALGAGSADTQDLTLVTPGIVGTRYCFFNKSDSKWSYSNLKALENVKLGLVKDYTFGDKNVDGYIAKNAQDPKRIDISSGDEVLDKIIKKIGKGEVDVLIEDFNVVKYYLKKNPDVKLKSAGCLTQENVSVALSKKTKTSNELNRLLTEGISQMKSNGELQKILLKYGLY